MVERAARWTRDSVPSIAALAASVILLRDGQAGLETYLLHRHARMAFAPSMVVFPGGRVDEVDASDGDDPIRRCALRETSEETGVATHRDRPLSLGALDHPGDRAAPL